jgi:PTS system nitrogen regulatory IIA component
MDLADILSEESVIFCTDVTTKSDLLKTMAARAAQLTGKDVGVVLEAIEGREALGSTGLGNGIAIPHGKLPGLEGVAAVFARLATPIEFDAVDDQPVDLVMLLLAPLGSGADHLRALALVARILRTESVLERLRATDDPRRLHDLLTLPLTTHKAA